jgi:hypothetical protein
MPTANIRALHKFNEQCFEKLLSIIATMELEITLKKNGTNE